jgi:hypothetical protein
MNRKMFTILLLAVFVLAQFGTASAATVTGTASFTTVPAYSRNTSVDLTWSVTGMTGGANQNILIWARLQADPANSWGYCANAASVPTVTTATDTYTFAFPATVDQDIWEFMVTVDDSLCAGSATVPATDAAAMGVTVIDTHVPDGFRANPPSLSAAAFTAHPVSCNTFEMWSLVSDNYGLPSTALYSGVDVWNLFVLGTYAPPAPLGPANELLSWKYTLPSTAKREWSFSFSPSDKAGNEWTPAYFRNALAIDPAELEDCKDFTDVAGHDSELYVRYLADLDLIAGNPDFTYGPDNTLTRAEASALFEKANGYISSELPTSPPSTACTFTDVASTDWFSGWVWQACADGFMNGLGGGLFGPADLLTRGQIVTIFNNINLTGGGDVGSFLDGSCPTYCTVLNGPWGTRYREAAFTDVSLGTFYIVPIQNAYGIGVAEGTSDSLFAPNDPVTRGEFAKWFYRALSRVP